MDVQFAQAKLYLSKLTASHFSILNTKIANQNVLERILIAMRNENQAKSNENFAKYKNCKPERAGKDSHCHAQREHGQIE